MNYYFSKGEEYLENGEPREGLEGEIRLLAKLAAETDEDVELGKEINDKCDSLSKTLPSDWEERALSEVLTSGYDPVKSMVLRSTSNLSPKRRLSPKSWKTRSSTNHLSFR